jgi:hypothetical protein
MKIWQGCVFTRHLIPDARFDAGICILEMKTTLDRLGYLFGDLIPIQKIAAGKKDMTKHLVPPGSGIDIHFTHNVKFNFKYGCILKYIVQGQVLPR